MTHPNGLDLNAPIYVQKLVKVYAFFACQLTAPELSLLRNTLINQTWIWDATKISKLSKQNVLREYPQEEFKIRWQKSPDTL